MAACVRSWRGRAACSSTLSAVAFGFAVSGMHYTAMAGMHLVPPSQGSHPHVEGLAASSQMLSLVVALLCFVIAAGFLLSLVPDPRKKAPRRRMRSPSFPGQPPPSRISRRRTPAPPRPARGSGRRRSAASASRPAPHRRHGCRSKAPTAPISSTAPTSGASGPTLTIQRCMTAPGSGCARGRFRRPKPSSTPDCSSGCTAATSWRWRTSRCVRKEGDGAIVELDGPSPHRVPVSRAKIAEVKARLGLVTAPA